MIQIKVFIWVCEETWEKVGSNKKTVALSLRTKLVTLKS